MASLERLQDLYDRNRFLEAYRESVEYWKPSQPVGTLSSEELIFGARLAARLGGARLCRRLLREALDRNPSDARVRYFTTRLPRRNWRLFHELLDWEAIPELSGADPDTQASWLASQAVVWASLRDFTKAHWCIERARSFDAAKSWVSTCESNALGLEDRWNEALISAELAWESNPGAPYAAHCLGQSLLNLRRAKEAAERLEAAAENCESFEVTQISCWHSCTLVETLEGPERSHAIHRVRKLAEQLTIRAPLADRETRALFARCWLDIAELEDDHEAMERWADEVRSPFHRTVLKNLRNNSNGLRIRLPFRHAVQKHEACLPTSVASVLATLGTNIDPDTIASEITFGGTPEWAAAEWLEKRGFVTRFFAATPEVASRVVKNGIAFVLTLEADASAHAVAVVGLDEAAGTLIIHDPQIWRTTEYLFEHIGQSEAPLGPKGMAIVPRERAPLLDQLLSPPDVEAMTATETHQRANLLHGPTVAREVVEGLARSQPSHPITRLLRAIQALDDGRAGVSLAEFQELLKVFPNSALVRARLLSSCRSLGNTALMRSTLAGVVERGMLPGIQSQQAWVYPPGAYVSEYADLLGASAETSNRAHSLLHGVIRRESGCAQAWHVLGDLLWSERDISGALLAYRIATCLAGSSEHYARAYCDALGNNGREEEGLKWLENRVRTFGHSSFAIATWVNWISALEDWGRPERALAACEESLNRHGESPELLAFVAPFVARMGRWDQAEALLKRLEAGRNPTLYQEAAVDFYRMRGDLEQSILHAQDWVSQSPLSMNARRQLVHLIAQRDGISAAMQQASRWLADNADHDELEQLYCELLDRASASPGKKYVILRRRLKRNPEDGWAWRELAFLCVSEYRHARGACQTRLARRILCLMAQCERTAPEDPSMLRLRAEWSEAQRDWSQALDGWLESSKRDPGNLYAYQQISDLLARFDAEKRNLIWQKIAAMLPTYRGRLSAARDAMMRFGQRMGVAAAEEAASCWSKLRPEDPEVVEACVDLLLEHGQGRTDAQRALEMLTPAVGHFPYHLGLRFSLADAHRKLGKFNQAEEVLVEIIRRHPDNSSAQIQLARVHERHGRVDEALQVLELAAVRDPQNTEICDARVQILIGAARFKEAHTVIAEALSRFPQSVQWRERAIRLFLDCGDAEGAVRTAREGVRVYPRGAYLWFLLGQTLNQLRRFTAPGEIESCLRRSLALNSELFAAADQLAMVLVEQRQYAEAAEVISAIGERLSDPTPAQGRLAWVHREQGNKREAREEMASILRALPWYGWGWGLLMDWLVEDSAWEETRKLLAVIPAELKTHTQFRRQRLLLLEKAGLPPAELDLEWNVLLHDFPEDVALHLHRYDTLRDAKRLPEAAAVLEIIRRVDPDSPFVLARLVEVLAQDKSKRVEAIKALLSIFFAETEESNWPANHAWAAAKKAHLEEEIYPKARDLLQHGSRPTLSALFILASYAALRGGTDKRTRQPLLRTWFPDRGARDILSLLEMIDSAHWEKGNYRACILRQLSDFGYHRLVVKYWKKHREQVESDVESWAQTGRALVALERKKAAGRFLAGWRERTGVAMWVVANYVVCFSSLRSKDLREALSSCRDALAGLPHDHCAKYLAHRQAEACALLGDPKGFLDAWKEHRSYFDGKL